MIVRDIAGYSRARPSIADHPVVNTKDRQYRDLSAAFLCEGSTFVDLMFNATYRGRVSRVDRGAPRVPGGGNTMHLGMSAQSAITFDCKSMFTDSAGLGSIVVVARPQRTWVSYYGTIFNQGEVTDNEYTWAFAFSDVSSLAWSTNGFQSGIASSQIGGLWKPNYWNVVGCGKGGAFGENMDFFGNGLWDPRGNAAVGGAVQAIGAFGSGYLGGAVNPGTEYNGLLDVVYVFKRRLAYEDYMDFYNDPYRLIAMRPARPVWRVSGAAPPASSYFRTGLVGTRRGSRSA